MKRYFLITLVAALALQVAHAGVTVTPQHSGVDVRLRGISAVNTTVAWASGQNGTVLRTADGGSRWQVKRPPHAETLDFRDIEGFDAETAVVLSIGPGVSSRVYRTEDGGEHWALALQNRNPDAFFDCMTFEGQDGWLLGDPIDGRFQIYATKNGGRDWQLMMHGPVAAAGEAAFAASGTCISHTHGTLIVASGGTRSRLHFLRDGSKHWQVLESGMARQKPEAGVFSIAATDFGAFSVGGDYKAESAPGNAANWYLDSKQNSMIAVVSPRGYRSGVACAIEKTFVCIAVGPSGVDTCNSAAWNAVSDVGYDAVDLIGNVGWMSGDSGRIARIEIKD